MLATSESPNMYTKKVEQSWKQMNCNQVSCKIISMPYPNIFQGSCSAVLHLTGETKKSNMDT